jgi:hypothetical protein
VFHKLRNSLISSLDWNNSLIFDKSIPPINSAPVPNPVQGIEEVDQVAFKYRKYKAYLMEKDGE